MRWPWPSATPITPKVVPPSRAGVLAGDGLPFTIFKTDFTDKQVGTQVLGMFRDLAKRENRALVIVTHDPKVRSIADRVIQIQDGRIAA